MVTRFIEFRDIDYNVNIESSGYHSELKRDNDGGILYIRGIKLEAKECTIDQLNKRYGWPPQDIVPNSADVIVNCIKETDRKKMEKTNGGGIYTSAIVLFCMYETSN
jgi:hypothetical protein